MADHGYTEPTPIQVQAIPVILAGRDLLGAAQTGTGKTAGFTLPLLQRLAESGEGAGGRAPRALILVPTRELAAQVHESVRTYGTHLTLRSAVIFGGVGAQPQIDALRRGLDILVATPGRLLDLLQQKAVSLGSIEFLVLDEADRMLDMGFIHDIRKVLAVLPAVRQNLLFSATFSDDIRRLAGTFLKNPATVEVARRNTPAELVAQVVHPVEPRAKRDLLAHLVKTNDWRQVLVFVRTKHGANRLAEQLERAGVEASAIHGNKSQNARTRALKRFKDGDLRVLVATDIAARGLDIEALPHVVNFDIPHVAEDYVHRIGRTGRAGTEGEAVSLVSQEEGGLFAAIERLIGQKITRRVIEGYEGAAAPVPGAVSARHTDEIDADRPPMESRERSGRGHRPASRGGQPGRNASGGRGRRGGGGGRVPRPQGAPRQDNGPRGEADGNRAPGTPRSAPRTSRPQPNARPAWRGARGRGSAPIDADERTRQLNDFRARARQDPGEHRLPPLPREDPAAKPEKVKREPTIVRRVASRLSSLLAGAPRPVPEREEK